jgi:small-conductance mechanosensitive channel
MIESLAEFNLLGNSALAFSRAVIILAVGIIIVALVRNSVGRRLRRKSEQAEHSGRWWIAHVSFRRVIVPLLYVATVWIALLGINLGGTATRILRGAIAALGAIVAVRAMLFILDASLQKYTQKTGREEDERRAKPLLSLISFLLWIIAFIFLLDNFGFNISTLVAGLGVSGIAVAIAAQGILGDLFNYFVIFFDRPFEIGDFIIFDDKLGSIEKIGIKTTRIRALSGEQLVVSNSNLVNARLHNYKRMERRRVVFRIGVTYQTPLEKLKAIPDMIRGFIEAIENAQFDRSHFQGYGDFALTFETVYYVGSPDYVQYMDIQQEINLKIFEAFEKEGIEFAYPTQTIFIETPGHEPEPTRIGFQNLNGKE